MDVENDCANPSLTRSTPQSQEIPRTSIEPRDSTIDKVRDRVV